MSKRIAAFVVASIAALLLAAPAQAEDGHLRVMSWNVWGIPVISQMRDARMERIVPALCEHAPDLVALQEVWQEEDGERLVRGLADAGYPHAHHFAGAGVRSGLVIASKYPIEEVEFVPFTMGRMPHTPWHVDWFGTKGVALAHVRTPQGRVTFANTHLQAPYATDGYLAVRVAQALEVADVLRTHGRGAGTILAGDINSPPTGLPFRLLAERAGLLPAARNLDIDAVLFRSGGGVSVRAESVRHVLTETVDVAGTRMPLSDHPAVLADLRVQPCDGDCAARSSMLGSATRLGPLTRDALAALRDEARGSRELTAWARGVGAVILALVLALALRARRRRDRPRWVRRALGIVVVSAAAWLLYLGFSYGPSKLDDLERAETQLVQGP